MQAQDWLQVVVIPVSLAVLAMLWPLIQNWNRRRTFMNLIRRELREIGPFPSEPDKGTWSEHLTKVFIHQRILREVSDNRDFVLSLDPEIVYFLSQLWDAHATKDDTQWLHYLKELRHLDTSGKLEKAYEAWCRICELYKEKAKNNRT